jgi:hypothetical protein
VLERCHNVALTGPDELPPTLVFDYPSVAAIADFVLSLLPPAPVLMPQPQPPAQLSAAAAGSSSQQSKGVTRIFNQKVCGATAAPWLPAVRTWQLGWLPTSACTLSLHLAIRPLNNHNHV